ncbi:anti-sigma regulatory factor (Ser/Thr protein kinase) [Allocatelliglobosispora scoriae]|uniref:Anti-sigma regulatory factor (Ser/Thr protein kinase) n=1 Tax=Allocatelliglobosispora scoriae TaxID=643052 RepID=A0A841BE33_9ACTN|nr:ATP-binding protein [Allocatelliglobosispora scoriae]MBB5867357.1 anti-sigma regulatory factor (Ser/Thr protein kinase) [Allocatelliglobosispora scoriae]
MKTATIQLPPDTSSSEAARRFVRSRLDEWAYAGVHDDVIIATAELVSNAVRHVGSPVRVRLRLDGGCLRLEVGDDSSTEPTLRAPDVNGGFGLTLVDSVCQRWGVDQVPDDGKIIWCDCGNGAPVR